MCEKPAFEIGQTVRLKNTSLTYTVHRLYISNADTDGDKWKEEWAELYTKDGKAVFWKMQQLEALSPHEIAHQEPTLAELTAESANQDSKARTTNRTVNPTTDSSNTS